MFIIRKDKFSAKNKSTRRKGKAGFSLVETLVSVFIFSLTMVMLVGAFSSFVKSFSSSKKMQRDIENAQYAMNVMAKTLRTSSVVAANGPFPLKLYDFSQQKCVQYGYSAANHTIQIALKDPGVAGDPSSCDFNNMTSTDLTDSFVYGAFVTAVSSTSSAQGKVTVALNIKDSSSATPVPIQMTVSLRNK